MISFKIKVANFIFEVNNTYPDTYELCKDYLTEENSEHSIEITNEDIVFEREKSIKEAIYEGIPIYDYSDGYLESIAVYRKIADYISFNNATVFHGALIGLNDEGYLFSAKSGTGKTTHVSNWLKVYKDAKIINGDKPIIRIEEDGIYAYGTPWAGKENLNINERIKLKAIIVLERSLTNQIEEVKFNNVYPLLFNQTYRPFDAYGSKRAFELISKIGQNVKLYRLGCNMDEESAVVAYEGMK